MKLVDDGELGSRAFWQAVAAELLGTMLFQMMGGSIRLAEYNGLDLVVVIYMTARASGGMVNPAVAGAVLGAGKISLIRFIAFVVAQLAGGVIGALLNAGLMPGTTSFSDWGTSNTGPGCTPDWSASDEYTAEEWHGFIFGWEMAGTFMLCTTVLHTAVDDPAKFGAVAPVAIGLTVFVNAANSGHLTGGCYNPARFFGPALAFGCRLDLVWLYWLAQATGSALAVATRFVLMAPPPSPQDQGDPPMIENKATELLPKSREAL